MATLLDLPVEIIQVIASYLDTISYGRMLRSSSSVTCISSPQLQAEIKKRECRVHHRYDDQGRLVSHYLGYPNGYRHGEEVKYNKTGQPTKCQQWLNNRRSGYLVRLVYEHHFGCVRITPWLDGKKQGVSKLYCVPDGGLLGFTTWNRDRRQGPSLVNRTLVRYTRRRKLVLANDIWPRWSVYIPATEEEIRVVRIVVPNYLDEQLIWRRIPLLDLEDIDKDKYRVLHGLAGPTGPQGPP